MTEDSRQRLRRRILAARDLLDEGERTVKSRAVTDNLLSHPDVIRAEHIFAYMHFRSEVQTLDLIKALLAAGKTVSVPYTLKEESRLLAVRLTDPENDVAPGYCAIPEPKARLVRDQRCDPKSINLAIVPGSVFDPRGGRLGFGGGFYDRFFCRDAPGAVRIGLAFELQLVEQVPMEPHDKFMDFLVTEKKTYSCGR